MAITRRVGENMRRTLAGLVLFMLLLLVVVGCSNHHTNHAGMDMESNGSFSLVNVELNIQPNQVKVNEKVVIEAVVTQDNKKVTDADKVIIEIVPTATSGKPVEIPANHVGEGKYTVETSFDQADTYSITSHVTVGAMHTMPKKDLTVMN